MANTAMTRTAHRREPTWWNDQHTRAWDRVKEAFARDWSQTQADFSKRHGRELDQSLVDTVKQAAGTAPLPPRDIPNDKHTPITAGKQNGQTVRPPLSYEDAEPALRYGHGASSYYFDHDVWDASLEAKLRDDWSEVDSERDWPTVRDYVRRGWEHARGSR